MNTIEDWKKEINKQQGITNAEREKLFSFISLFESNQFEAANSAYWELDEFLRGAIPENIKTEIRSEIY